MANVNVSCVATVINALCQLRRNKIIEALNLNFIIFIFAFSCIALVSRNFFTFLVFFFVKEFYFSLSRGSYLISFFFLLKI